MAIRSCWIAFVGLLPYSSHCVKAVLAGALAGLRSRVILKLGRP